MGDAQDRIAELRRHYARYVTASVGARDPRLEHAFATIPREKFLPPGPWQVRAQDGYIKVPRNDPAYIYQDVLIALDAERGVNNGEPSLHARWLSAVAPEPGETVVHIGTGGGYYSAILAMLVAPDGQVEAYEIDPWLAALSRVHLRGYERVSVHEADAMRVSLPKTDIIYVNAGIACPPRGWLLAMRPQGRMIFPWQAEGNSGLTVLVIRRPGGYLVRPLIYSSFIGCAGRPSSLLSPAPSQRDMRQVRSLWLTSELPPDDTAIAVCEDVWFSSRELESEASCAGEFAVEF